jgi:hypothetical protein
VTVVDEWQVLAGGTVELATPPWGLRQAPTD